jgi:hypothetical protein
VLGEHLDVREHGHEVRVAGPARHDVQVDVIDDSCAGHAAQIPADVVALWSEDLRERACAVDGEAVDVEVILEIPFQNAMPAISTGISRY